MRQGDVLVRPIRKKALKWDLVEILGNEAQFRQWMDNFLIKDRFIEKTRESGHYHIII